MDFSESTKIVYNRIRKLEPENVKKIIGYIFLNDHGEQEMIRLAFSPESEIRLLIAKARFDLRLPDSPNKTEQSPTYFSYGAFMGRPYSPKMRHDPPVKVCHYFIKGFCKHGNNCRFLHGPNGLETFPKQFNHASSEDNPFLSNGSLEKLEMELTELLKSRGGSPVSIATLPMLYFEMYGRTLQAEGYLTESQRHGKAGFSLSKLLARLKNSIHLIDRPHGQHSVVLAKDAHKYLDRDQFDLGGIVSGSRQIYLTFPSESGFTELDVSKYFNKFGPVQDVRIPGQQKGMFGFVTFVFPETTKQVLTKGNPHYICGARVLVKPYRVKSRITDRKTAEKVQNNGCHDPRALETDYDIQLMARFIDIASLLDTDQAEEREFLHVGEAPKPISHHHQSFPYSNHSRILKDVFPFPEDGTNYFLDGSSNKDAILQLSSNNCSEQDSQGINLPESPFASSEQRSITGNEGLIRPRVYVDS